MNRREFISALIAGTVAPLLSAEERDAEAMAMIERGGGCELEHSYDHMKFCPACTERFRGEFDSYMIDFTPGGDSLHPRHTWTPGAIIQGHRCHFDYSGPWHT